MRNILAISFPALLILTGVRLVMTEAFLRFEYNRPGFPADRYGFSTDDRLNYGRYGIRYLLNNEPITYLANLTLDDRPLFREKELQHMEDVQYVTRLALRVHYTMLICWIIGVAALSRDRRGRYLLRQSLAAGSIFTLGGAITLAVLVVASWDVFFEGFHKLFFEGDSWLFRTSDSLIRLYPEQFWFDAALTIGGITVIGALATIAGVWWWERRIPSRSSQAGPSQNQNGTIAGPVG